MEGLEEELQGVFGTDDRFGSEAEVGSCPGLAAFSTSGVVNLDRHARSTEPEPELCSPACGIPAAPSSPSFLSLALSKASRRLNPNACL